MEWSIQQTARAAGTTTRTLRYYGEVGLLEPSRVGANGYRYYDEHSLVRLQRILLLRDLGLSIDEIGRVLVGESEPVVALAEHLNWLKSERGRLERQITSVQTTIEKLKGGEELMAEEMFDGFDHTTHRTEVIGRWGRDAYDRGDRWWNSLSDEEKQSHQSEQFEIAIAFATALKAGKQPNADDVQQLAARQVKWLSQVMTPSKGYLLGLGEMYVADPRFAANYERHGEGTAAFVRDALAVYGERNYA